MITHVFSCTFDLMPPSPPAQGKDTAFFSCNVEPLFRVHIRAILLNPQSGSGGGSSVPRSFSWTSSETQNMSFGLATPPLSLPTGGIARTFFLDPSSSVLALPAGGDGSSLLQLHILKQGNICNTPAQIERILCQS